MLFMDPVWDSFPFYMRTVQSRTITKITRVGSATDTRSDRSEFVFRPVPCKRMKRNVWRAIRTHTGPSSCRSHVITPNSITVHSNTRSQLALRHWICQKWAPAGHIGDFGNFLNGFAKNPRLIVLNIDWVQLVLKNCEIRHSVRGLYDK